MNSDFSITYTTKNEYTEIEYPAEYTEVGYHTTPKMYKDSILKNGFKPSIQKNDWLGEGVYFWDNEENALFWRRRSKSIPQCILVCDLKCQISEYLDLDKESNMKNFEKFLNKYFKSVAEDIVVKPVFKNNNERRKFFCDLYCSCNNIRILSFTFTHEIINKFGFRIETINRRQICVREPKYISIKSIKE